MKMKKQYKLMLGDNMESLKKIPDNSIDSIVSDPPYGLSFMNKKWDYNVPTIDLWKEVYRVLKPGGMVLSFGGTRTYHRMVVNLEDAGFEIRDCITWNYGSGFPKSLNIGKAVDKIQGNEREVIGEVDGCGPSSNNIGGSWEKGSPDFIPLTKGTTPQEGWGTALKPSVELICMARKPLSEKTVAENVLKWGTGGINVDGCRVGSESISTIHNPKITGKMGQSHGEQKGFIEGEDTIHEGRFPANSIWECCCDEVIKGESGIRSGANTYDKEGGHWGQGKQIRGADYNDKGDIHTNPECPCFQLDEQSGVSKSSSNKWEGDNNSDIYGKYQKGIRQSTFSDKGGASRFFYVAKVSKSERNMGLNDFTEEKVKVTNFHDITRLDGTYKETPLHKNTHPTLKPVQLMSYLVRLVTPPNGIVLDPFMGSGSTGIAACLEGFRFCGMELSEEYFKIAEARIDAYEQYRKFIKK